MFKNNFLFYGSSCINHIYLVYARKLRFLYSQIFLAFKTQIFVYLFQCDEFLIF